MEPRESIPRLCGMEFVKSLVGGRSRKEQALRLKEEGNKYFGALEFAKAVECYTKGIDLFPLDDKGLPAVVIDTSEFYVG